MNNLYYVIGCGILAMLYAFWKTNWINSQDEGSERMKQIGKSIAEGAMAFLKAEYKVLAGFVLVVAILLAFAANSQGETCTGVKVAKIWWACRGMGVNLEFDASTNVLITGLPADSTGDEYYDEVFSGIPNNAGSGKTGDIDFTTVGHSSGDTYSIILELIKTYA